MKLYNFIFRMPDDKLKQVCELTGVSYNYNSEEVLEDILDKRYNRDCSYECKIWPTGIRVDRSTKRKLVIIGESIITMEDFELGFKEEDVFKNVNYDDLRFKGDVIFISSRGLVKKATNGGTVDTRTNPQHIKYINKYPGPRTAAKIHQCVAQCIQAIYDR